MAAVLAALDMATEGSRAAALDCRHHLELAEAQMPCIGGAPGGAMAMKDVCDLQPWAAHGRWATAWLHPGSWAPFGQRRKPVERAGDRSDRGAGNTRVKRGGVELGMAKEHPRLRGGRL